MTGTSIDGIDAVLIQATGHGLDMQVDVIDARHDELGPLAPLLRAIAQGQPHSASQFAHASTALGQACATSIEALLKAHGQPTCIALHGQTVHHAPPTSLQLIDPSPVVAKTGIPTVIGQRAGDLACDGQGAPITPLADWVLYRNSGPRVIVNLGGFANATALPGADASPAAIAGADLCPCNHLLDTLSRTRLQRPFDVDGACAAAGSADATAAHRLATDLLNATSHQDAHAMGEADLHLHCLEQLHALSPNDAAATLSQALARVIADRASALGPGPLALAGGSTRHTALVHALADACTVDVALLQDASTREGAALAVLALLELDGIAPTLPQVTNRTPGPCPGGLWMAP